MKTALQRSVRTLVLLLLVLPSMAAIAAYPEKPIKLIVPFGPGGGTDILARLVADRLSQSLGTPVVIENKAGAGGTIGSDVAAKSAPDGYTLLMATNATLAFAPSLYPKLPYNPVNDFTPISMIAVGPSILVVNPSVEAKDVAEFIALLKQRPGALNYGSAGAGSMAHVSTAFFARQSATNSVHIPFKGGAAAVQELVAGRLQFMIAGPVETIPLIEAGKVRALGVTTSTRFAGMPNLPTLSEAGLPSYEIANWFSVVAPAGVDPAIASLLAQKITAIVTAPAMKALLVKQGVEPRSMSGPALKDFIRDDVARWTREIKQLGITLE
ncbi:MAG: tripartite tricarboxylate transporter substrate binding protein [Casimicrobiaceae bacterium]